MNYLENIFYEFRPFFYLTIASACYSFSNERNFLFFATLLLSIAAVSILKQRYVYRYGERGTRNDNYQYQIKNNRYRY